MPLPRSLNSWPLCVPGGIVPLTVSPSRQGISTLVPSPALAKSMAVEAARAAGIDHLGVFADTRTDDDTAITDAILSASF